jgi:uncharacterized membrane protein YtjA (UPF0391 family)
MSRQQPPSPPEAGSVLGPLLRTFRWERMLYLAFGLVSLSIFVFSGYRLLAGEPVEQELVLGMLGSTGVAAACSARVVFFLSRVLALVEMLATASRDAKGA